MMLRVITFGAALVIVGSSLAAGQPGKEKKDHGRKHAAVTTAESHGGSGVAMHVTFASRDVQLVRTHYAPRFSGLPPGLQKKVARGGALPPGWQKKVEPFPPTLERELPPLPAGYSRGVIDAHAVIYSSKGTIVDVAVLF